MNLNVSIIDQRVSGIVDEIRQDADQQLNIRESQRLKSLAFLFLCVKTILDLDYESCFDALTEGGQDFGIDAIHSTEEIDGEFIVTLFQSKYHTSLDGINQFPANAIDSMINAVSYLFNPSAILKNINARLAAKVEIVRSQIRDGAIPKVRVIACSNGLKWNAAAEESIARSGFGSQVEWEYVNHDTLVNVLRQTQAVSETLRLSGSAVIEDLNFSRVCIGRIAVSEIATLMKRHGEKLLERNIRRYLGLHGNRVNEAIRTTLKSHEARFFYFFNNGITLVCDDFHYNGLQKTDYQVRLDNLQIVNGGQTCMTILKTLGEMEESSLQLPEDAFVLIRIYKLPKDNEDIIFQITHATNSQNPVDLKDLRANDHIQRQLDESIKHLGYTYRRKRSDQSPKATEITSGVAAEAVLSIWRKSPQQAKYLLREHFGKLYTKIFSEDLNGAQTIAAVLLYRIAENHRKRPDSGEPEFVRYASCFAAMLMGQYLLDDLRVTIDALNHTNFPQALALIESRGEQYYRNAIAEIGQALRALYGERDISMQQLAATFRRGDLISRLDATQR